MKEQGNLAMKALAASEDQTETLEKASYYYAQALLIFYYLIPDNDEQEKESNELKISCHLNQSLCFLKMKRYDDAMRELQEVARLDPKNVKALFRKATVQDAMGQYTEALETIESLNDEKLTA